MCNAEDYLSRLKLLPEHLNYVMTELQEWHAFYLPVPPGNVVDLGAGCGETALFYLMHGAKKVIAIEGNPMAYQFLCENFKDDERVVPILMAIDTINIDIEGGERGLVLETHHGMKPAKLFNMALGIDLWGVR